MPENKSTTNQQINWIKTIGYNFLILMLNTLSFLIQLIISIIIEFNWQYGSKIDTLASYTLLLIPIVVWNSVIYFYFKRILFVRFKIFE